MNRKLTQFEVEQVVQLYKTGVSTYDLATQFGTNRHTITRHLRRSGVKLRLRQR